MTIFTVKANQYVSGSGPSAKLADLDIMVRYNVNKRIEKLGSKVFVVGELDLHENKLCIELHNFEYISGTTPYTTTSSPTSSPLPSFASEKKAETPDKVSPKVSAKSSQNRRPRQGG